MDNKKKAGAPKKKVSERKVSMTCSVTPTESKKAIKLFGSRGKAITWAITHYDKKQE